MPTESVGGSAGPGATGPSTISPSSSLSSHLASQARPPAPDRPISHRSTLSVSTTSSSSTGSQSKRPKFLSRNKKDDSKEQQGGGNKTDRGSKLLRRRKSDASVLDKLPSTIEGTGDDRDDDLVSVSPSLAPATVKPPSRQSTASNVDLEFEEEEILNTPPGHRNSVASVEIPRPASPTRKTSRAKTLKKKTSKLFSGKASSINGPTKSASPAPTPDVDPSSSLFPPPEPISIRRSASPASTVSSEPVVLVESSLQGISSPLSSMRRPSKGKQRSRPGSTASTESTSLPSGGFYQQPAQVAGSSTRIHDISLSAIPNRLGGWLSNLLPTHQQLSSSPPNSLSGPSSGSTSIPPSLHAANSPPRQPGQGQRSFVSAAREKGAIGRYFLDSDAKKPERNQESIWVMGKQHDGWKPGVDESVHASQVHKDLPPPPQSSQVGSPQRKGSTPSNNSHSSSTSPGRFTNLFAGSSISIIAATEESSPRRGGKKDDVRWPADFYEDFRTSVWCTYRSQYAAFAALPPHLLAPLPSAYDSDGLPTPAFLQASTEHIASESPIPRVQSGWAWVKNGGGSDEKGLTTDSGWGCMLRTGQTLLANGLFHHHLGRDWRRPEGPPTPSSSAKEVLDYATYVRILSWFMDDPLPYAPFSVHRMALIGKQLGKEIGSWFGPSTAAGAIKTLVGSYPYAGVAVSVASDGVIIKSDVFATSQPVPEDGSAALLGKRGTPKPTKWGSRPVVVLVGVRLGMEGVNPIYHDSVRDLFTFPQSLGIAGGRPSSSYYFLGYQGDSLIYLDPHHTRPAVPLNPTPSREELLARSVASVRLDDENRSPSLESATPTSTDFSTSPIPSPDPFITSPPAPSRASSTSHSARLPSPSPARNDSPGFSPASSSRPSPVPRAPVDPLAEWFAAAYPPQALQTFHCDKVRKMSFGQLDPSMLLGFLCKDEADWNDFRRRVANMPHAIFSIGDEASSWDDDDDVGLESFSETDPESMSATDDQGSSGRSPSPAVRQSTSASQEDVGVEVISTDEAVPESLSAGPASALTSDSFEPTSFESTSSQATPQHAQHPQGFIPSTERRPSNPRALGSEFEMLDEDDWRGADSEDVDDRPAAPGSPVSKRRRPLASQLQSSLAFPRLGKDDDDSSEGPTMVGSAKDGPSSRKRDKGSKLRRKQGTRSISGATARPLRESDEDEDDDWNDHS